MGASRSATSGSVVRVAIVAVVVTLVVSGLVVAALRWPNSQPIRIEYPAAEEQLQAGDHSTDAARGGKIDLPTAAESPPPDLLDINIASASEMETLPGIGPTLAGRIVRYREEHGPFSAIEELMNVQGIGERTFDSLRGLVTVH